MGFVIEVRDEGFEVGGSSACAAVREKDAARAKSILFIIYFVIGF
jgi:hypothetical protein